MQKTLVFLKRKWILALIAAAVVGSGAYAFAATLNVTSSSLGAGNAAVASCAASTRATYTTTFDAAATGHYRVSNVALTLPDGSTCAAGDKLSIVLEGTGNTQLGNRVDYTLLAGDLPTGGADSSVSVAIPASPVISANLVTGVAVAAAGV